MRLQQVSVVTDIIYRQNDKVMYNFCRLQGLQGYLLYIVRLRLVTEVTGIIHRQKIKLCTDFKSYNGYETTCCIL